MTIDENSTNQSIDALFIASQFDKCKYASDVRSFAFTCRASWNEEAFWCAMNKVQYTERQRTHLMYNSMINNASRLQFLLKRGHSSNFINIVDARGRTALHYAALHNSYECAKLLLDHGADINVLAKNDDSALTVAVANYSYEVVKLLLSRGCRVINGNNTLLLACYDAPIEIIRLLFEYGASPLLAYENGLNAFHILSHHSEPIEVAKMVIEYGGNVDQRDIHGQTPLFSAVIYKKSAYCKFLIEQGANPNAQRYHDLQRPIHIAEDFNTLEALVHGGADLNAVNIDFQAAILYFASQPDGLNAVRLLTEYGANINIESNSLTPLYVACQNGHYDIVKYLLNQNAQLHEHMNAFYISAYMGHMNICSLFIEANHEIKPEYFIVSVTSDIQVVKLFLDHGADPNTKNSEGRSILDISITSNSVDIVQLLLQYGADPNIGKISSRSSTNAFYQENKSALYFAARLGHFEIVKLLLKYGANVDGSLIDLKSIDYYNTWSPLSIAIAEYNNDIVKLLIDRKASVNTYNGLQSTPLIRAIKARNTDAVKMLLDAGASPNYSKGLDPLMLAVSQGSLQIVKYLISYGGKIECLDKEGRTPLIIAIKNRHKKIISYLIHSAANVNITDLLIETPLLYSTRLGDDLTVKLLLDRGANPNVQNAIGFTPLHFAAELGHGKILKMLLIHGADRNICAHGSIAKPYDLAKWSKQDDMLTILQNFG